MALESKMPLSDWLKNCVFIHLDFHLLNDVLEIKSDCYNIAISVAIWLETFLLHGIFEKFLLQTKGA